MPKKSTHKQPYIVKQSAIHGKGLFARRDISEGDIIGNIKHKPTKKDGPYVLWVSESLSVQVECDLKYINHHSQPNACYYEDMKVVALSNIKKGEEITHDYGEDWS